MSIAAGFVRMLKISGVNNNYLYMFLDEAYEDSTLLVVPREKVLWVSKYQSVVYASS